MDQKNPNVAVAMDHPHPATVVGWLVEGTWQHWRSLSIDRRSQQYRCRFVARKTIARALAFERSIPG